MRMTAKCAHEVSLSDHCDFCQREDYCDECGGCHLPELACDAPVPTVAPKPE